MTYVTHNRPYKIGDTDSFKRLCQSLNYQPLKCGDISCTSDRVEYWEAQRRAQDKADRQRRSRFGHRVGSRGE